MSEGIELLRQTYPEVDDWTFVGSGGYGDCYRSGNLMYKLHNEQSLRAQGEIFGTATIEGIDNRLGTLFTRIPEELQGRTIPRVHKDKSKGRIVCHDYHEGITLYNYVNNITDYDIKLTPLEVINRAIQITERIDELQETEVIHGDLKPENVLLTGSALEETILLDVDLFTKPGIQNQNVFVGSLNYTPPEYWQRLEYLPHSETDPLGKLLYFWFTGRHFIEPTLPGLINQKLKSQKIQNFDIPPLAELPIYEYIRSELREIIQKSIDPEDERCTAKEVIDVLSEIKDDIIVFGFTT